MTSTNDGKDVKSNPQSGHKGKTYYIELYKSLEARLSGSGSVESRATHAAEAWRSVHTLCQHSAPSTHTHLLSWLQRHTYTTILQTEWQSPSSREYHKILDEALFAFIDETKTSVERRNGVTQAWEVQLLQRAEWLRANLQNPWGHPTLRLLLDPREEQPTEDNILEWLREERGTMFVARLKQLTSSKCDDLALSLATSVMDRVRSSTTFKPDAELISVSPDKLEQTQESPFRVTLSNDAGFTVDVWELIGDIEFVLLYKLDKRARCIELAKLTPLRGAYQLVERLRCRLETSPREKKLWKSAKDVAALIAQVVIARCMVVPACTGVVRAALYCMTRALCRVSGAGLPRAAAALAAPAATAHHLHTLAHATHAQVGDEMKPFVCELYVRALTAGMNELERLKLKTEKEAEARATEKTLSSWFSQVATLLSASPRLSYECALTAFSVHPAPLMFDRIHAAPHLPTFLVEDQEPKLEAESTDFGSWANDSRAQTNFVKTSEHLKLKQSQNHSNVLSTAILNEGEAIGLGPELCQDLAVLLSGPRVKTLSWDMDRETLLENCRQYMERTNCGTRALTTELKYLNLDYSQYQHLPEEQDDNHLYYGIEKGYEHLVEFEPDPEEIWEVAADFVKSEASSDDSEIVVRRRKKKKPKKPVSDNDSDPLSLVAEAKKKTKKVKPHSKVGEAKCKVRKPKKTESDMKKVEGSETQTEKKEKKPRKPRKKKELSPNGTTSLADLVGVKVSNLSGLSAVISEEAKNKEFKKERRRSKNTTKSVTDSDYDSQGKLSGTSETLLPSRYPMDEVRSSERQFSDVFKTHIFGSQMSSYPETPSPDKVKQNPTVNKDYKYHSGLNRKDLESFVKTSNQTVTPNVKSCITNLLNFRRQKAQQAIDMERTRHRNNSSFNLNNKHQTNTSYTTYSSPHGSQSLINTNEAQSEKIQALTEGVKAINKNFMQSDKPLDISTSSKLKQLNNEIAMLQAYDRMSHQSQTNVKDQRPMLRPSLSCSGESSKLSHSQLPENSPRTLEQSKTHHQKSFEQFLQDLQNSFNAGVNVDATRKINTTKPTQIKTKVSDTNSKKADVTPQCAKLPQKKVETAPNTFSRLSYMHKNKQTEEKVKHDNDPSRELDNMTKSFKADKVKYLQMKGEVSISRVSNSKESLQRQSAKTETKPVREHSVSIYKAQKPSNQISLTKTNPILAKSLASSSVSNTAARQDSNRNADPYLPRESNFSIMSAKDEAELLLLLRQQNKLNYSISKTVKKLSQTSNGSSKSHTSTVSENPKVITEKLYTDPSPNLYANHQQPAKIQEHTQFPSNQTITAPKPLQCTSVQEVANAKKQDWASVMNDLLSHKTPYRGPNALNMALNKKQIEQTQTHSKSTEIQNSKVIDPKTFKLPIPIQNESVGMGLLNHDLQIKRIPPSKQIKIKNQTIIKPADTELTKNRDLKKPITVPKVTDVILSGNRNSEYDLLDELFDDDLRKEIGELSSDEDTYTQNTFVTTTKNAPIIQEGSCYRNTIQDKKLLQEKSIHHTILSGVKNQDVTDPVKSSLSIPSSSAVSNAFGTAKISTVPGLSAAVHNATHVGQAQLNQTPVTQNVQAFISNNTNITNVVSNNNINIIATKNIYLTPAPQSVQSMIVMSPGVVYDQFSNTQNQPQPNTVCVNNTFVAINNAPNLTLYQSTQYAAPVINSYVIGNAMTTQNTSVISMDSVNRGVNANTEPMKSLNKVEVLTPSQSNTTENMILNNQAFRDNRKINLDINSFKNCERKVLSQMQEKLISPDKSDKINDEKQHVISENVGIKAVATVQTSDKFVGKVQKEDQERLQKKRFEIINRKVSHRCEFPAIPLTYSPLNSTQISESENSVEQAEQENTKENIQKNDSSCRRILLRSSNKLASKVVTLPKKTTVIKKLKAKPTLVAKKESEKHQNKRGQVNLKSLKAESTKKNVKPRSSPRLESKETSVVKNELHDVNKKDDSESNQITNISDELVLDFEEQLLASKIEKGVRLPDIVPIAEQGVIFSAVNNKNLNENAGVEEMNLDSLKSLRENETNKSFERKVGVEEIKTDSIKSQEKSTTNIENLDMKVKLEENKKDCVDSSQNLYESGKDFSIHSHDLVASNVIESTKTISPSTDLTIMSPQNKEMKDKESDNSNEKVSEEVLPLEMEVTEEPVINYFKTTGHNKLSNDTNIKPTISSEIYNTKEIAKKVQDPDNNSLLQPLIPGKLVPSNPKSKTDAVVATPNINLASLESQPKRGDVVIITGPHKNLTSSKSQPKEDAVDAAAKRNLEPSKFQPKTDAAFGAPNITPEKVNDIARNSFKMNSIKSSNKNCSFTDFENNVIYTELPSSDPNKKCICIKLPNGFTYKATVRGDMAKMDMDKLFQHPSMRKHLYAIPKESRRYVVNVKQISQMNSTDNVIKTTTVINKVDVSKPEVIDTVDLISDDEKDDSTQQFQTEYGTVKIKNIDDKKFHCHQVKFSQKCEVRIPKCLPMTPPNLVLISKETLKPNSLLDHSEKTIKLPIAVIPSVAGIKLQPNETIEKLSEALTKDLNALIGPIQTESTKTDIIEIDDSSNEGLADLCSDTAKEKNDKCKQILTQENFCKTLVSTEKTNATLPKESAPIIIKKCFVPLTRCDHLVQKTSVESVSADDNDSICSTTNSTLSRCGSLSILNDFTEFNLTPFISDSEEENAISSPVMKAYESIVSLNYKNRQSILKLSSNDDSYCDAEWRVTKQCERSMHKKRNNENVLCSTESSQVKYNKDNQTDCVISFEKNIDQFKSKITPLPTLIKLVLNVFERNSVLYSLKPIHTKNIEINSTLNLKRKNIEPANSVLNKMSKLLDHDVNPSQHLISQELVNSIDIYNRDLQTQKIPSYDLCIENYSTTEQDSQKHDNLLVTDNARNNDETSIRQDFAKQLSIKDKTLNLLENVENIVKQNVKFLLSEMQQDFLSESTQDSSMEMKFTETVNTNFLYESNNTEKNQNSVECGIEVNSREKRDLENDCNDAYCEYNNKKELGSYILQLDASGEIIDEISSEKQRSNELLKKPHPDGDRPFVTADSFNNIYMASDETNEVAINKNLLSEASELINTLEKSKKEENEIVPSSLSNQAASITNESSAKDLSEFVIDSSSCQPTPVKEHKRDLNELSDMVVPVTTTDISCNKALPDILNSCGNKLTSVQNNEKLISEVFDKAASVPIRDISTCEKVSCFAAHSEKRIPVERKDLLSKVSEKANYIKTSVISPVHPNKSENDQITSIEINERDKNELSDKAAALATTETTCGKEQLDIAHNFFYVQPTPSRLSDKASSLDITEKYLPGNANKSYSIQITSEGKMEKDVLKLLDKTAAFSVANMTDKKRSSDIAKITENLQLYSKAAAISEEPKRKDDMSDRLDSIHGIQNNLTENKINLDKESYINDIELKNDDVSKCCELTSTEKYRSLSDGDISNTDEPIVVISIINDDEAIDILTEDETCLVVNIPKLTYFKESRKRKLSMREVKTSDKKYRKGKNIDYPKLTASSMRNSAYVLEFKRLIQYYETIDFSYSRHHIFKNQEDCINVGDLVKNWPNLNSTNEIVTEDQNDARVSDYLFKDVNDKNTSTNDPMKQSLVEELSVNSIKVETLVDGISEINFEMGFGEGSDRVIQNFISKNYISKYSAATLSDVKQSQPFLLSDGYERCNAKPITTIQIDDQIQKLRIHSNYLQIRRKIRSFFEKTTAELNESNDSISKEPKKRLSLLDELCTLSYMMPPSSETIVQVVQVGQLPVSAAAQNPVTCDPRVTQVSDASPSQCSIENSPRDDSPQCKAEYTELTTADITMPIVQEYAQQNQDISMQTQESASMAMTDHNIPIETELNSFEPIKEEIKEEPVSCENENDLPSLDHSTMNNIEYSYDSTNTRDSLEADPHIQVTLNSTESTVEDSFLHKRQQNGSAEKTDQIAHAMNAAGITTTETPTNTRTNALVNILSQKEGTGISTSPTVTTTNFTKTSINALALQQALAQILPPPLNQTNTSENNQQNQNPQQVLHIVQGKNATGNQITLLENSQQSVISNASSTQVLHIVQNKNVNTSQTNGTAPTQTNAFSGLSLVDAGLQQGGNQLLHIVNTGNQKNPNAGQLLKRVNLLTNLANMQGSNEQKMLQFVCKSADGKPIQLNGPHQRSMVLRLQPIETTNVQTAPATPKPVEPPETSPTANSSNSTCAKDAANSQSEIKSRSVYEENYAKFIQNSSTKPEAQEKSTSLPKFNQAFGKPVFQEGAQKPNEMNSNNSHGNTSADNNESQPIENPINLDHMQQINSPPLLLRKSPAQTTQAQPNLVQQLKQTIAPMNIQTMHGGVIYTRQIPVNIGGGQTINLITVPSTELIDDSNQKSSDVKFVNQGDIEPSIIKIVPQSQNSIKSEGSQEEGNNQMGSNDSAPAPQPQQVLTQMRIKLPMLSKNPQMVPGARVVRPSFFQIHRNVIGGANQPVYQQLVLTAAPSLGQQTIRLPQAQTSRPVKVPSESQSSTESQMSTSTLEQLREFDMVLEQVKERSTTVQPSSSTNNFTKLLTTSTDTTDSVTSARSTLTETTQQVLYSIGTNQSINVAYVNRKIATVSTPTTSSFVRTADSSGIADTPSSSTHCQIPHTVRSDASSSDTPPQPRAAKVGSKSKPRPKASSNPPNTLKLPTPAPKTSSQKPIEDEQTTQRILYILAEYKEQVENSPDKDKPAPRRRSNPPSNPSGSSKRKKSSSGCRRRDMSPMHGEDTCRTMGSEDSSCGTSQGDCTESCYENNSPQDSPRKVARKLTFEQETTPPAQTPPRTQPQRNIIVADGQTITVARGTAGKPATAVIMPTNYILPVSVMKGGQQIAIVTNRGPKLLTMGGGEAGTTNALLLQRLIGPAGLKPVLTRPGVRHVRLPTTALHNLQAFNIATSASAQPPDSSASPASAPTPDLIDTRASSSPWADQEEPKRPASPDGSEPWHLTDPHDYSYEETVRTDNMDRTVLDPDRYSPDMEAQRIFDKMFDVDSKKSLIDSHDGSPRCAYDIDASDCDDKPFQQVVQKKDGSRHAGRLTHASTAALRHKYAMLEHELRLQKSLSEECSDLGVDSPSASELFPEAELLFAASPAVDHDNHEHAPQPTPITQSSISQPDLDDQTATDELLRPTDAPDEVDGVDGVELGLEAGIVTVSEDGLQATIALDHEEFARSHPNTTFHSEPTDGEVQPFTIAGLKGRQITSTIFHSGSAPATVLMTAPQTTVISQATAEPVKFPDMMNPLPSSHSNDINLSSVLVKDEGLTRFDTILNDSRELHLSNTASAIVHSVGNATQVIRRVYDEDKRERERFLMDETDGLIADDPKTMSEDSSREATLESMADGDDDDSIPDRHVELFWESNSASERSESRRPLDYSSDSEKCCKSPSYDETNSTDSSVVGAHMRLDSVIKEARSGECTEELGPRTYPARRVYLGADGEERSLSGKTRAGERSPDSGEVRRRASARGIVKRPCHCCNGSPAPPRNKKSRPRKPTLDFTSTD